MELAEQFRVWALEPVRTNDELYTIELLVESARVLWCQRHQRYERPDWDARHAHSKQRMLNPAYRAHISREKLDALVEVWADMRVFRTPVHNDRPLGELETLRFFPQLTDVEISGSFTRIDALAGLRELKSLSLASGAVADIGALAGLPKLKTLRLSLHAPWPAISALAALPSLRHLHFRGNLLVLRDIPGLPAVVEAEFNADFHWKTPLRDLSELPAMPVVRQLRVESVAGLAGVERFPALNLQLEGPFADLSPLAAQSSVTWLRLQGQGFHDLRPLSHMAALRELRLERELPLDLSPLADAPRLRQAWVHGCDILATELAAINALLPPWADDFLLPHPRPLAPLCFIAVDRSAADYKAACALPDRPDPRAAFYGEDKAYAAAENCWFEAELRRRLDALLGRGWRGRVHDSTSWSSHGTPGGCQLTLNRYEDTLKLREVVRILRELMAAMPFPWEILLIIEPHGNLDESMADIAARDDDDEETAIARERMDWQDSRRRERERREFLERQYRLRLQQEQGLPINAEDFSPPPEIEEPEDEDADGGAVLDPGSNEGADSLGASLVLYAILSEQVLSVWLSDAELAADYYGEKPLNWHEFPGPPEKRPRPR
jgi:hypothetical protein